MKMQHKIVMFVVFGMVAINVARGLVLVGMVLTNVAQAEPGSSATVAKAEANVPASVAAQVAKSEPNTNQSVLAVNNGMGEVYAENAPSLETNSESNANKVVVETLTPLFAEPNGGLMNQSPSNLNSPYKDSPLQFSAFVRGSKESNEFSTLLNEAIEKTPAGGTYVEKVERRYAPVVNSAKPSIISCSIPESNGFGLGVTSLACCMFVYYGVRRIS